METLPLRRLLAARPAASDRIFFSSIWFRGHNNPRAAELLPRLDRLDRYLVTVSDHPILRPLEYRALTATKSVRDRAVFRAANRRYRSLFTVDNEQIAHFRGAAVADVDDPTFSEREVALLRRPNLRAYVVTDERAAVRFRELGVDKPHHVIPQGVSLSSLDESAVADVRTRLRSDGDVVVAHVAAWLLSDGDRGGESPLYNIDHLLELWDEIHTRLPRARLWLIGGASARIRTRCAAREDVVLLGRLERPAMLAHLKSADIALYPRTKDQGIRAAKVAEYMGLGLPTVAYDFEVVSELRDAGAGILVDSPREFVDAVVRLAEDEPERRRVAVAASAEGARRDWDALAEDYRAILDRYLPA